MKKVVIFGHAEPAAMQESLGVSNRSLSRRVNFDLRKGTKGFDLDDLRSLTN